MSDFERLFAKLKPIAFLMMGLVYIVLGVLVIYKKYFLVNLDFLPACLLGTLLILYGIFRMFRAIKETKKGS